MGNCVGCSSWGAGSSGAGLSGVGSSSARSSNIGPRPQSHQEWKLLESNGYPILVQRDPETGKLLDIKLEGQVDLNQFINTKTKMVHVIDYNHDLEYLVQEVVALKRWVAIFPMDENHRNILEARGKPIFTIGTKPQIKKKQRKNN